MKKITLAYVSLLIMACYAGNVMAQFQEASPNAPIAKVLPKQPATTWDVLFSFSTANGGEQGVETDGTYIYTCKWGTAANSYFNKYSTVGVKLDSFLIPGVTNNATAGGIRDLAYANGFFYGSHNNNQIYKMNFTTLTLAGTLTAGIPNVRNLCYDPNANGGAGGFWAGGWSDLNLLSMTGSLVSTVSPPTSLTGVYGTAYDGVTPGGPYLWLFNQDQSTSSSQYNLSSIYQFNIATSSLTGVTHHAEDVPGYLPGTSTASTLAGGLASNVGIVAGKFVLLGDVQQSPNLIFGYELAIVNHVNNQDVIENIVKVYPNPASDVVNIKSGLYVIDNVSVTNNLGQLVYQAGSNGTNNVQINSSNWVKGMYFVAVQTVEGTKTYKINVD